MQSPSVYLRAFIPHIFDKSYTSLDWTPEEKAAYEDLEDEVNKPTQYSTYLLGYQHIVHFDMHLEAEFQQTGIPYTHSTVIDSRNASLADYEMDWTLLLQLKSIYEAGLELGEAVYFFWIRKQTDL